MPVQSLHRLGDEPIYCEAVHGPDDDVYSGSDDDYYEGPLHRRLHIEKKAIDYLAGHVPVLLSAKLQGPFDSRQWNNPWRSRRAARQSVGPGTQTILSKISVERARGHGSDQVPEDLVNTQGTSLYPLPSPEITNPPSARKNPYMEEEPYNRISVWREAVKSTTVTRDPFWLSRQDDSDDMLSVTRKRSADPKWLHKGESKKRKSTVLRTSPFEESPSRAAAKTRKNQTRRPIESVTLSAQASDAHEDELAAIEHTKNETLTTRLANRGTSTPRSRRIERRSPHRWLRSQEAETSEDELSMPSTTPTHKAARTDARNQRTPKDDGSPIQHTTRKNTFQSRGTRGQPGHLRMPVVKIQASQLSAKQRSSMDAAKRLSKDAARMEADGSWSLGKSHGQRATRKSKPVQIERAEMDSITVKPKTHAKLLADNALSQQDDSFFFHKRTESPVNESASRPSPVRSTKDVSPSLPSEQMPIAVTAVGPKDDEHYHEYCEENGDAASVVLDPAEIMEVDANAMQQIPCNSTKESEEIVHTQIIVRIQSPNKVLEGDEPAKTEENQKDDGLKVKDVVQPSHEAEAMVMVEAASETGSVCRLESSKQAMSTDEPQAIIQDEDGALSEPEWSTYLEIQDLPSSAVTMQDAAEEAYDRPVIEQGVDPSEPERSSYLDTQDLSTTSPPADTIQTGAQIAPNSACQGLDDQTTPGQTAHAKTQYSPEKIIVLKEADDVPIIEQDLNGPSDPEWATFTDTPDQAVAAEPQHDVLKADCEQAANLDPTNPAKRRSAVEDDGDSRSELSNPRSANSENDVGQTSDPSYESIPPGELHDAKPSQAIVGSIIDAYAEAEQTLDTPGQREDNIVPTESQYDIVIPNENRQDTSILIAKPKAAEETRQGQEHVEIATGPMCATGELKDGSLQSSAAHGILDETTSSIAPPLMADAGMFDETASITEPRQAQDDPSINLQTPQAAANDANAIVDYGSLNQATASLKLPHLQSPWVQEASTGPQVRHTLDIESKFIAESDIVATANTAPVVFQSPWTKDTGIEPLQPAALPPFQPPQSSWLGHTSTPSNLPTPDFTMSIKAFSDFATPSPTKKRVPFNGSILRNQFKTPVFQEPGRRVHFALCPGEEEASNTEADLENDGAIYVEEDVSYFERGGRKTGTVRVPRQAIRAASPPPTDVTAAEVGGLVDHDSKFARHFEAMAKRRKNPPRKPLRLLPSDSQQTTSASQGAGAMAEAFIQASQTRRKALEMAEARTTVAKNAGEDHQLFTGKTSSPIAIDGMEEQENVEPVDDVSAVLDNLDDFLDDTWGVGLDVGAEDGDNTPLKPQGENSMPGIFGDVGDPMVALHTNVWAD